MNGKLVAVVSRARTYRSEHELLEKKLVQGLCVREGIVVVVAPHLYDLTMEGPGLELLRSIPNDMAVLSWLYPRAAYWVLDANQVKGRLSATSSLPEEDLDRVDADASQGDTSDRTIWCFDLRMQKRPEPLLAEVDQLLALRKEAQTSASPADSNGEVQQIQDEARARWYPVIDYQRCDNCLECLNFCLFGVYSLDADNSITVEEPDACRAGCPACSRICPQGAIMFPQHKDPGIAGDAKASLAGMKLDLSQLFSGQNPGQVAAMERQRALAEKREQEARTRPKDELDSLVDELDELDL